jgi:hypothetical protein
MPADSYSLFVSRSDFQQFFRPNWGVGKCASDRAHAVPG